MPYETYSERIAAFSDRDPRHVEAWMRVAHGTLDQLDLADFESEICVANACIEEAGDAESEYLALSYGL